MKSYKVKYKIVETNSWTIGAKNQQSAVKRVKREYTDKDHKVEIVSVDEVK